MEATSALSLADDRALALDVDGVLTDGGLWWGPNGEEWKRFCFADIMGVSLARRPASILALISGEDSPLVDRYAAKDADSVTSKRAAETRRGLREFAEAAGVKLHEICFMGDDVNDLHAMEIAGFSAAPANAATAVCERAQLCCQSARRQRRRARTHGCVAGCAGPRYTGSIHKRLKSFDT